jgi:hypothetical protein
VIGFRNASLAVVISAHLRRTYKQKKAGQRGRRKWSVPDERNLRSLLHELSSP